MDFYNNINHYQYHPRHIFQTLRYNLSSLVLYVSNTNGTHTRSLVTDCELRLRNGGHAAPYLRAGESAVSTPERQLPRGVLFPRGAYALPSGQP